MASQPTINCLKCLLEGIQRPAIRLMRATGEPCCAIHSLIGLPEAFDRRDVRRNDPCHCGSGKKYKKCHGTAAAIQQANAIKIELPKLEQPGTVPELLEPFPARLLDADQPS